MTFKEWLKDVAIRTIKTMAEAALGAGISTATTIGEIDWRIVGGTMLAAAVATVFFNISTMPFGGKKEN